MGATTFSIGDVDFDELSSTDGQYAMEIRVSAPIHKIHKFHPPGTDGNLLIFDGRTGGKIVFRARYVGDRSTILASWKADRDSWVGAPVDVVDDAGETYERCVLESCEQAGRGVIGITGTDRGYFDIVGVLSWEG